MKNTLLKNNLLVATFALILFSNSSFANSTALFSEFNQHCKHSVCESPYVETVVYDSARGINQLSPEVLTNLQKKAFTQAQIWGDTILEGDYFAEGNTQVLRVTSLSKNGQAVGLHFTYAEKAWYTGDCDPGFDYKEVARCQSGRIIESSFATPDLVTIENDFAQMATFEKAQ